MKKYLCAIRERPTSISIGVALSLLFIAVSVQAASTTIGTNIQTSGTLSVTGQSYLTGNVGIGTTTPEANLSVTGNSNQTGPLFDVDYGTGTATSSALYINSSGNVGIGTSGPVIPFQVGTPPNDWTTNHTKAVVGGTYSDSNNLAGLALDTINTNNVSGATTVSDYGLVNWPTHTATLNTSGTVSLLGIDTQPYIKGTITAVGANSVVIGGSFAPGINATGIFPKVIALKVKETAVGGTVTNAYDLYGTAPTVVGGGSIVNKYGIYLENQSAGTALNYAIYTNAGKVHFGDQVDITANLGIGTTTPSQKLDVNGSVNIEGSANGVIMHDTATASCYLVQVTNGALALTSHACQ